MSARWFRFYADAMRNPKVARLSDKQFRLWVQLLSVAAENGGTIPPVDDLKLILNRRLDHLLTGVKELLSAGLIDQLGNGYEPHNWNKFQYKSDTSNERVAKHRAKRNVTVTPPETETESEDNTDVLSQRADAQPEKPAKPKKQKPATFPLPDDFQPQPFGLGTKSRGIVDGWPPGQLEYQTERFKAHHRSKGSVMADWQDAWTTWVLNSVKFGASHNGNGNHHNQQSEQSHGLAEAIAERRSGRAGEQPQFL